MQQKRDWNAPIIFLASLYSQQHHCLSGQMTDNVPSTDVTQLSLTLKMTITQVVKLSVTDNNSPTQDYTHLDNHTQPTYKVTPGFTINYKLFWKSYYGTGSSIGTKPTTFPTVTLLGFTSGTSLETGTRSSWTVWPDGLV